MKIKLKGFRGHSVTTLSLSNMKKYRKFFPPYFTIEIDTSKIKERKKGE